MLFLAGEGAIPLAMDIKHHVTSNYKLFNKKDADVLLFHHISIGLLQGLVASDAYLLGLHLMERAVRGCVACC
jgi:hypothetical protein